MPRLTRLAVAVAALAACAWTVVVVRAAEKRPGRHEQVIHFGGGGGRLGLALEDVGRDDLGRLKLGKEEGALVRDVTAGSAAEKAGLKAGDVILRYHGEPVWSASQLARMVRETPAGRTVDLEVSRDGAIQKLSATLELGRRGAFFKGGDFNFKGGDFNFKGGDFNFEMPALPDLPEPPEVPEPPEPPLPPRGLLHDDEDGPHRMILRDVLRLRGPRKLGIAYQELSDQLAGYFKVKDGVLVTRVDEDGAAGKAGMKAGDIIVKFGSDAIEDGNDLREAVDDAKPGTEVSVTVQRDGRPLDLKIKLAPAEPRRARRTDI